MAVSFDEVIVNGPRYRITDDQGEVYFGFVTRKYFQTDEDKAEIHRNRQINNPPPEFFHHQFISDHVVVNDEDLIKDGPGVTYELLPAEGGRRRRKSRRSYKKSRQSHKKPRKTKRNTRL
jgi:hypothetical protein